MSEIKFSRTALKTYCLSIALEKTGISMCEAKLLRLHSHEQVNRPGG